MAYALPAQIIGLTSAGLFTGYTWALSLTMVPTILKYADNDKLIGAQWREQYLHGFYISRPMCIASAVCFFYLAYHSQPSSLLRSLYILSALLTSSGVPYALTILRTTNGALSIRTLKLLGPLGPNGEKYGDYIALWYASNDRRALAREKDGKWTTKRLVERWAWHNWIRTGVLVVGCLMAAAAVGMDRGEGGW